MRLFHLTVLSSLLVLTSSTVAGEGGEPPPPHDGRKGPPPMFDASLCKGKTAGATVETTAPDGKTIRGTCQLMFVPERARA